MGYVKRSYVYQVTIVSDRMVNTEDVRKIADSSFELMGRTIFECKSEYKIRKITKMLQERGATFVKNGKVIKQNKGDY